MTRFLWLVLALSMCVAACAPKPKQDTLAFLIAAEDGNVVVLRQQLEYGMGADDVRNVGDMTALCLAARMAQVEAVRVLLAAGADPLAQHKGAPVKLSAKTFHEQVKALQKDPGKEGKYRKADGTMADMRTLTLRPEDCTRALELIDAAIAAKK